MKEPKLKLDYSSPALDGKREVESEILRRQAIEDYDEATFGEHRPIASMLWRLAVFLPVIALLSLFLPQILVFSIGLIVLLLFWF